MLDAAPLPCGTGYAHWARYGRRAGRATQQHLSRQPLGELSPVRDPQSQACAPHFTKHTNKSQETQSVCLTSHTSERSPDRASVTWSSPVGLVLHPGEGHATLRSPLRPVSQSPFPPPAPQRPASRSAGQAVTRVVPPATLLCTRTHSSSQELPPHTRPHRLGSLSRTSPPTLEGSRQAVPPVGV